MADNLSDVIAAKACAGETLLVYVDGEYKFSKEPDNFELGDIEEFTPIGTVKSEWRIGDIDRRDPPETYEALCEVTDV